MKTHLTIHATMTRPAMTFSGRDIARRDRHCGHKKCLYHFVIARDGELSEFRKDSEPSPLDGEFAKTALSVCLVGGATDEGQPENNFTLPQWDTLKIVSRALKITHVTSQTKAIDTDSVLEIIN